MTLLSLYLTGYVVLAPGHEQDDVVLSVVASTGVVVSASDEDRQVLEVSIRAILGHLVRESTVQYSIVVM